MKRLQYILCGIVLAAALTGCQNTSSSVTSTTISTTTDPIISTTVTTTTTTTTERTTENTTHPITRPTTSLPITTEKLPETEPQPPAPEGTGLLSSLSLTVADNPRLAKDLSFSVDEEARTATLTLDYQTYADLATLSDARLTATAEGGEVSFAKTTADGRVNLMDGAVCVVTDANGWVKRYQLIVNRKVYRLPIVNITLADGKAVDSIDRELTTVMTFSS